MVYHQAGRRGNVRRASAENFRLAVRQALRRLGWEGWPAGGLPGCARKDCIGFLPRIDDDGEAVEIVCGRDDRACADFLFAMLAAELLEPAPPRRWRDRHMSQRLDRRTADRGRS